MNIKNQEIHDEARELAGLTGETLTQAVGLAVHERLERVRHEASAEERARQIMELSRQIASRMSPETLAIDVDELLYDERGLPK